MANFTDGATFPGRDRDVWAAETEEHSNPATAKRVTIVNAEGSPANSDTPLFTANVDESHRVSANTIFGDRFTGKRISSISASFVYPLKSDGASVDVVGSGSVSQTGSTLTLSTGTDIDGSVLIQSREKIRNRPGHEEYMFVDWAFNTPVANSLQYVGLFSGNPLNNDVDGYFLGFNGTDFIIANAFDGTIEQKIIDTSLISNNFITQVTNIPFNITNLNSYKISFAHGSPTIHFEIMRPDGSWYTIGEIGYPSTSRTPSARYSYQPLSAFLGNTGNNTNLENVSTFIDAGIINGSGSSFDASSREFNKTITKAFASGGDNTIVIFRNKTSFKGIENRIPTVLEILSYANEGTKQVQYYILRNPTFTAGTFTDMNPDSVVEFSEDSVVTNYNTENFLGWVEQKEGSNTLYVKDLNLTLYPGETAAFVTNSANATDVFLSVRLSDKF